MQLQPSLLESNTYPEWIIIYLYYIPACSFCQFFDAED